MQYRKKSVVIEAFRLGFDFIPTWFEKAVDDKKVIFHWDIHNMLKSEADIKTLEGWHHASSGDYIICGVKGEIYPCKPDIFEITYELME